MNGILILIATSALGVDYGWQPHEDGGLEYVIQIEPSMLQSMSEGFEISSEILAQARNVRRFRIRVGTGPVPREGSVVMTARSEGEAQPPPPETLTDAAETFQENASRWFQVGPVRQASAHSPPLNMLAQADSKQREEVLIPPPKQIETSIKDAAKSTIGEAVDHATSAVDGKAAEAAEAASSTSRTAVEETASAVQSAVDAAADQARSLVGSPSKHDANATSETEYEPAESRWSPQRSNQASNVEQEATDRADSLVRGAGQQTDAATSTPERPAQDVRTPALSKPDLTGPANEAPRNDAATRYNRDQTEFDARSNEYRSTDAPAASTQDVQPPAQRTRPPTEVYTAAPNDPAAQSPSSAPAIDPRAQGPPAQDYERSRWLTTSMNSPNQSAQGPDPSQASAPRPEQGQPPVGHAAAPPPQYTRTAPAQLGAGWNDGYGRQSTGQNPALSPPTNYGAPADYQPDNYRQLPYNDNNRQYAANGQGATSPMISPPFEQRPSLTARMAGRVNWDESAEEPSEQDDETEEQDAAKPWMPLILSMLMLFGSIGLNVYLASISADFYKRYRALAEQVRSLRTAG